MTHNAFDRRGFLALTSAIAATPIAGFAAVADTDLAALEARIGGRVGVAAMDAGNGKRISHRGDERFAMCSTFKWLLAAAVLAKVDAGKMSLSQKISFAQKDLLPTSPATTAHVRDGAMTVEALCDAAIKYSDNVAANLLLAQIGGPAEVTRFLRTTNDRVTRLDRIELDLNSNLPGDKRDTTTPNASLTTLQNTLLGNVLTPGSRDDLADWMRGCRTGLTRLRAGLPKNWNVGDKTGTGDNNAVNDVAIAWPPGRAPILIASYLSESKASLETLEAAHASIARLVVAAFAAT